MNLHFHIFIHSFIIDKVNCYFGNLEKYLPSSITKFKNNNNNNRIASQGFI